MFARCSVCKKGFTMKLKNEKHQSYVLSPEMVEHQNEHKQRNERCTWVMV